MNDNPGCCFLHCISTGVAGSGTQHRAQNQSSDFLPFALVSGGMWENPQPFCFSTGVIIGDRPRVFSSRRRRNTRSPINPDTALVMSYFWLKPPSANQGYLSLGGRESVWQLARGFFGWFLARIGSASGRMSPNAFLRRHGCSLLGFIGPFGYLMANGEMGRVLGRGPGLGLDPHVGDSVGASREGW